jgi:hypothetical protein
MRLGLIIVLVCGVGCGHGPTGSSSDGAVDAAIGDSGGDGSACTKAYSDVCTSDGECCSGLCVGPTGMKQCSKCASGFSKNGDRCCQTTSPSNCCTPIYATCTLATACCFYTTLGGTPTCSDPAGGTCGVN